MKKKQSMTQTHAWALLLVAAGESKRLKSRIPKPFLYLDLKHTLLDSCLEAFKKIDGLVYTIIVTRRHYLNRAGGALVRSGLPGIVTVGGVQREDSVWNGLELVPPGVHNVLIHDAARPFVSPPVIYRVLNALFQSGAAIPVVPVKDTLKMVSGNKVIKTLDRSTMRAVQTPQGFRVELLRKAFSKLGKKASFMTDDAALVEAVGKKVEVVDGESANFKVTIPDDLKQARHLWAKRKH